jgi:putative nucleotidyltransferase with HDIG domain
VNAAPLLADTSDDEKLLLEAEALIGQALLLKVEDLEAVERIALKLAYVKTDRRRAVEIMCNAMRALYASIERAARLASRGLRGVLSSAAAPLDAPDYMTLLEASGAALGDRIKIREQFGRSIAGLERLAVASSLREDDSGARPYRVAELASLLAKAHGLGQDAVLHLGASARLHDIGKTAIPDIIAATRNNEPNRAAFESHVETGAKMLERSNIPGIKMAVEIARHHHERWDGGGYPSGLSGEDIPLAARIVAIADAFDAMTHSRTYRSSALSVDDALSEIEALSGKAFDPHLCKLFTEVIKDLVATHPDINIWLGREASISGFNKAKVGVWASLKRASERASGQAKSFGVAEPVEGTFNEHSAHNMVLLSHYQCQLLLKLGRIGEARKAAEDAAVYAQKAGGGLRSTSFAKLDIATVLSHEGQHSEAISQLEHLRANLVDSAQMIPARREVMTALVEAYERVGNSAEALRRSELLIEDLRSTSAGRAARTAERSLRRAAGSAANVGLLDGADYMDLLQASTAMYAEKVASQTRFQRMIEGVERLSVASGIREDESGSRVYRVGELAGLLAKEAGLSEDAAHHIRVSARLHDIGKAAIPDGVMLKAMPLSERERSMVESHAESGAVMLQSSNIPGIKMSVDIARHHHERWDGAGYPSRLAGENIPLAARIVSISDAFDAMTHDRCYRDVPLSLEQALVEVERQSGLAFDPALCSHFVALVRRLASEHDDLKKWLGREAENSSFNRAKTTIWASLKRASGRAPGHTGPNQAIEKEQPPVVAASVSMLT